MLRNTVVGPKPGVSRGHFRTGARGRRYPPRPRLANTLVTSPPYGVVRLSSMRRETESQAYHPLTHRLPEARGLIPPSPSAIYVRPSIRSHEWGWLGEGRPAGARSCDRNLDATSPPE